MDTTIHPEGSGHSDPRSVFVFIIIKENYLLVFGNDLKDPDSRVWTHRVIQSSLQLVLCMDTMIHPEGSGHSDPRSVCYKTLIETLNSMSLNVTGYSASKRNTPLYLSLLLTL